MDLVLGFPSMRSLSGVVCMFASQGVHWFIWWSIIVTWSLDVATEPFIFTSLCPPRIRLPSLLRASPPSWFQLGHKLANMNGFVATSRLLVAIIDHHMNQCTPWLANMQTTPHRLRILGNPNDRSIDTQIPTHRGQTCIEAIHLTLQIIESKQGLLQFETKKSRCSRRIKTHQGDGATMHPPRASPQACSFSSTTP